MAYVLGKDCTITIGGTELKNVKDVTLNLSANVADVTTRKSEGWVQEMPTTRTCEISFQALFDSEDTAFGSLQTAYMDGSSVAVVVSGSGSLTATCGVSNFSITQALGDAVTVDVTLKPMAGETAPSFS